jgi:hypothetical protein
VGTALALAEALAAPGAAPPGARAGLLAAAEATAAAERAAVWHEPGHAGDSPRLTAGLARVEALSGLASSARRWRWLLDAGAPLARWPELVHPRSGGGCAGEGHHGPATAAVLDLVRTLVVADAPDGLWLLPAVPPDWYGQGLEAHDVPTAVGRLSFAVRWHGERPALLWELEPHADPAVRDAVARLLGGPPTLRVPGLDPTWSSTELRGEALLAAPPAAEDVGPGAGPDGGGPEPEVAATSAPDADEVAEVVVDTPRRPAPPPEPGGSFS